MRTIDGPILSFTLTVWNQRIQAPWWMALACKSRRRRWGRNGTVSNRNSWNMVRKHANRRRSRRYSWKYGVHEATSTRTNFAHLVTCMMICIWLDGPCFVLVRALIVVLGVDKFLGWVEMFLIAGQLTHGRQGIALFHVLVIFDFN